MYLVILVGNAGKPQPLTHSSLNCTSLQANLIKKMKESNTPTHLAGDGKYDSPGKFYSLLLVLTLAIYYYIYRLHG